MNDSEFDRLVQRAGTTARVRASTLDRLVEYAATRRSSRRRKPLVIGLAVAGTMLLAAGASSDYWSKVPPIQSLEDDMYRAQTAIPVDFITSSDLHVRCEAFLEFKGLSLAQSQQVETYVKGQDWTGLGQRLYDQDPPAHESFEHAQARIDAALNPVILQAAAAAVPDAQPMGTDTSAARVSGWSMDCRRASQ